MPLNPPFPAARWLALVALLPACSGRDQAPPQAATTTAPPVVALSVADSSFHAPDTVDAGWVSFRFANLGDDIHYAHIVRLDPGRTVAEFVEAYAEAIRTSGPRPAWMTRFGGPGGAAPGDTADVTQFLEPGSYVWVCPIEDDAGTPHFTRGEYATFVVREDGGEAAGPVAAPVATGEIRLTEYGFVLGAPLAAGRHTIRVVNAGAEPHDIALLRFAPGTTLEEVRRWLNPEKARREGQEAEAAPPPPGVEGVAGGVAAIAPGMEAYVEATFTPGEYVLACMVTAPDGRSHIEHGMIQQVTVQ